MQASRGISNKESTGLIRRFDVVNRGFSGWNTANVVKYLPEIFSEPSASSPKIAYLVSANAKR